MHTPTQTHTRTQHSGKSIVCRRERCKKAGKDSISICSNISIKRLQIKTTIGLNLDEIMGEVRKMGLFNY